MLSDLIAAFDRPGCRILLAFAGSVYLSLRYRLPCRVAFRKQLWYHHFPGDTIVDTKLRLVSPQELDRRARFNCLYHYLPKHGDVIVDVGSGIGSETRLLSKLVGPTGRVVSVEAHPMTFLCQKEMIRCSELRNIEAVNVAIGDNAGFLQISNRREHTRNSVLIYSSDAIPVPSTTVDRLVSDLNLRQIDFLRMNIEGAEGRAIRDMRKTLERTRHVCISCHDFIAESGGPDYMRTKRTVEEELKRRGFRATRRRDTSHPALRDTLYAAKTSDHPEAST